MLQLTCSSIRPSPPNRACGFTLGSKKIKSFNSLNSCFAHALFSPSQSLFRSRIRISSTDKPGFVLVKIYRNADTEKLKILKENKGKAGVYRWGNLVNGKTYIGSSTNLSRRLLCYFNVSYLSTNNMLISKAILKHGYSNFALQVLEYCEPSEAISREQYYFDHLKPEYNILKKAGSWLGHKHSEETKIKLRDLTPEKKAKRLEQLKRLISSPEHIEQLKRLNSSPEQKERLKRFHANPEYQAKRLAALKVYNSSKEARDHLKRLELKPEFQAKRLEHLNHLNSSPEHKEQLKRLHANPEIQAKRLERTRAKLSHPVSVLDSLNNETTVYSSVSEAAQAIGVTRASISLAFKRKGDDCEAAATVLIQKRYQITKLPPRRCNAIVRKVAKAIRISRCRSPGRTAVKRGCFAAALSWAFPEGLGGKLDVVLLY